VDVQCDDSPHSNPSSGALERGLITIASGQSLHGRARFPRRIKADLLWPFSSEEGLRCFGEAWNRAKDWAEIDSDDARHFASHMRKTLRKIAETRMNAVEDFLVSRDPSDWPAIVQIHARIQRALDMMA
jgi:hypothetical protein